jgi:hypothetical protein
VNFAAPKIFQPGRCFYFADLGQKILLGGKSHSSAFSEAFQPRRKGMPYSFPLIGQ